MENKPAGFFDIIIALINGIFNLLKLEKVICIVIIYFILRDYYLIREIDPDVDITSMLLDAHMLERLLEKDNTLIIIMGAVIVLLLIVILIFVLFVRPMYLKEIDRLSEIRNFLMQGTQKGELTPLKDHPSSLKRRK